MIDIYIIWYFTTLIVHIYLESLLLIKGSSTSVRTYFVGVEFAEVGPGTLSAAYNSTDVDGSDSLDSTGFEVSYTYSLNDNVTITPGFFTVEDTSTGDDDTGVVVETVFSF